MSESDIIGIFWFKTKDGNYKIRVRGIGRTYAEFWLFTHTAQKVMPEAFIANWSDFPWSGFTINDDLLFRAYQATFGKHMAEDEDDQWV